MSARERRITLPAQLASVTAARHFARDAVIEWELEQFVDDVQLGTSELVANAVRHAGTQVTLTLRKDTALVIEVVDGQRELHRPFSPFLDLEAENGRGLQIVAAISDDWGISSVDGGKCIWFALQLPDRRRADADVFSLDKRRGRTSDAETDAEYADDDDADMRQEARASR
jgi:anti-sigma regulatory factor (Ser/Thr protein kinase)